MTIKLLGSFLLVVSAYVGWWAVSAASFLWQLRAVVTVIAWAGLFLRNPWSPYLWHALALVARLSLVVSVVWVALSGWPYESALATVISLIPGVLLLPVCAGGSLIIAKHFRGGKNAL